MVATAPHYLLLTETQDFADEASVGGFWRFALRQIDGSEHLEVSDTEPGVRGERLQLLAVIRGLEAIGQPSRVTLVTSSQYVRRGIRRDLDDWREMNWTWDRFGELHDIKHRALWQRLDHALQYHAVQCRAWKIGSAEKQKSATWPSDKRRRKSRIGMSVLDGWVKAARRMRSRTTVESLAANCV